MFAMPPRIAVVIPCHDDGALVADAVHSVVEDEPVDLVVVDDASHDVATLDTLAALEQEGVRVIRSEANLGVGWTRTSGFWATTAPFVYPLDADDLACSGVLSRMADALEEDPGAAVCVGDIAEFGEHDLVREVPRRLDPYRVAYVNEYPITALYRRAAIEPIGAWASLGAAGL